MGERIKKGRNKKRKAGNDMAKMMPKKTSKKKLPSVNDTMNGT